MVLMNQSIRPVPSLTFYSSTDSSELKGKMLPDLGHRGPESAATWPHVARQVLKYGGKAGRYYKFLCVKCRQTANFLYFINIYSLNQVFFPYSRQQNMLFTVRQAGNCKQAGILCESRFVLSVRTCLLMYQSKPENMKALNLKKHKNECSKIYLPVSSFVYFKIYLPVSSIVNFKIYLPASGIVYFKIFLSVSSIVDSDIYLLASNMNECSKIYLPASSIVYFKTYLPVSCIFDLKFSCWHKI